MSIFPKLQLAAAIKKHFQYALGLFICAFLLHCEVKSPVGNEKGAPFSGSIRVNDGVSVFPLKGAVVVINNRTTKTDSNGTFGYEKIRKGTYQLTISHASIIAIDTTITISKATHVDFVFRMFDFEGTVYRLLLPHEQVLNPYVPEFLRERAVIAASITLDGKYTRQAASNPGSCNENFDFGLVRMGTHRLQIAAPKTHPIDTVFVINHKSGCFLDTDAYHFTLPTIAPPQREFVLPLLPRSSWRYRYDYSQSSPVFHSEYTVTGQHTWTIKEVFDNGTTSTARLEAIRINRIFQRGIGLDTIYTKIDTVQFTITKSADKFVATWPRFLVP